MRSNIIQNGVWTFVMLAMASVCQAQWVAVNDHAAGPGTSANATRYNVLGFDDGTTGPLKDVFTGELLPATLTITRTGILPGISVGGTPPVGSPLYNTFNTLADFAGNPTNNNVGLSFTATATYTIANLTPGVDYILQGGAVRGSDPGGDTNLWTLFELNGADSFTSAHTANAVTTAQIGTILANQVVINTGRNHLPGQGDMFEWRAVRAGADGTVQIVCRRYNGPLPGGGNGGVNGFVLTALKVTEAIMGPVSIVQQPTTQNALPGDTVTFQVAARGNPINFQWQRSLDSGMTWMNLVGQTGTTLTRSMVSTAEDPIRYRVRVFNNFNSVTSRVVAVAILKPGFEVLPWNASWRYDVRGTDLGTSWRQPEFGDSTWMQGPGPMGDEETALPVPLMTTFNKGAEIVHYYRTTFVITNEPTEMELTFSNMIDDAAVFHLNGQEALRVNMPAGDYDASTLSDVSVGNAALMTGTVTNTHLIKGTNLVAVEVHQINNTSSDSVMGLNIWARFLPQSVLSIVSEPGDLVVEELKDARFDVGVSGTGATFQWLVDGMEIAGANRPFLLIEEVTFDAIGLYTVRVANLFGETISQGAALTVIPDTNAPVLLLADGSMNTTNILLSFSEKVAPATAEMISNYRLTTSAMTPNLNIISAVVTNGTNVLLTTAARGANTNYLMIVNGVADKSNAANLVAQDSTLPVITEVKLIQFGSAWRFYDPFPGVDPLPPANWYTIDYVPPANWGNRGGGFAYNAPNNELPIPIGTTLSQGAITKYFRTTFNYTASPLGATFRMRHAIDDGARFFLNNFEFLRINLPEGNIVHNTFGTPAVGVARLLQVDDVPSDLLVRGVNTMAVDVHGIASADLDWVFGLDFTIRIKSYVGGPILITEQPQDVTVMEGQTATISFDGVGPGSFQWFKDGVEFVDPNASPSNATLVIRFTPLNYDGAKFHVRASNGQGSVTSSNMTLTVLPDTVRPRLVTAQPTQSTLRISLGFNEVITEASATSLQNYLLTNSMGTMIPIMSASLTNGTNVILTTANAFLGGTYLVLNGIEDISAAGNMIAPGTYVLLGYEQLLKPMNDMWLYDDSGTNHGDAWFSPGFDDTNWLSGPGVFVAQNNDPASEGLPAGRTMGTPMRYATGVDFITNYYFRSTLMLTSAVEVGSVVASNLIDDGAIFYVNGQEAQRFRLPAAGAITVHTFADSRGEVTDDPDYDVFEVPANMFNVGLNSIAVGVHQTGTGSSDVVFGAEFFLRVPSIIYGGDDADDCPELQISMEDRLVTITWEGGSDCVLVFSSSATGPYTPVANATSPFVVNAALVGPRFYQLRK